MFATTETTNEYEWAHKGREINNTREEKKIWCTLQQTHSYAHFILIYLFISSDFFLSYFFSHFLIFLSLMTSSEIFESCVLAPFWWCVSLSSVPAGCVWCTQSVVCTNAFITMRKKKIVYLRRLLRSWSARYRHRCSTALFAFVFFVTISFLIWHGSAYGEIERGERLFTPFLVWWWCILCIEWLTCDLERLEECIRNDNMLVTRSSEKIDLKSCIFGADFFLSMRFVILFYIFISRSAMLLLSIVYLSPIENKKKIISIPDSHIFRYLFGFCHFCRNAQMPQNHLLFSSDSSK